MKVFISYSNDDKNKMVALERSIERCFDNIETIVVSRKISPGVPLSEKVKTSIEECDVLIPILTNKSLINQWVNQEIGYAVAKNKDIFPIVESDIIGNLKGFIHNQIDIPFSFKGNRDNSRKESYSYRKCYLNLLKYLSSTYYQSIDSKPMFKATVKPGKVKSGDKYTTSVKYKGVVKNGFFDNLVRHQSSSWKTWNWDKETLPNSKPTTAGLLKGKIDIEKEYSHSTKNWPKGKFTVYVRLYDHPVEGEAGRHVVAEEIKEIEII